MPVRRPSRSIDYTRRTALYRLFDAEGRLLYVGIAFNPRSRWAGHSSKSWWKDVAEKRVEWHATRHEALAAERLAIVDELPLYNKQDSPQPYMGSTTKADTMPPRVIRVDEDTWRAYEAMCAEKETTPSADLCRYIAAQLVEHRTSVAS